MRRIGKWLAVVVLTGVCGGSALAQTAAQSTAMAGTYRMDPEHSRLLFRVSHLGFSHYTALFTKVDATLQFDPQHPEAMSVEATVDVASLETHNPNPAYDFNQIVTGADLLDAAAFPQMLFRSTRVALKGPFTADVTGDLTLHGVTRPMLLHVTFNGGYSANQYDPGSRIGFSATGRLNRSDYGMTLGIPEPGTTFGVFDEVEVIIETEMLKPGPASP